MSGSENQAYENDSTSTADGKASGVDKTEIKLEEASREEGKGSEAERKDLDVFSRTIVAIRSGTWRFVQKRKKLFTGLFCVLLNILIIGYLVGVVIVYQNKGHSLDYWDGLGLLIVLYVLGYGALAYYLFLKPYLGPTIKRVVSPAKKSFHRRLWEKRYIRRTVCFVPFAALAVFLAFDTVENRQRLISFLGIVVFTLFGFLFSKSPGHVQWRPVLSGLALQFVFGIITIKWGVGNSVLTYAGDKVTDFLQFTQLGTSFVYGPIVGKEFIEDYGSTFAFSVLPVIFFFSFFVNMLSYCGVLQWFIIRLAWVMQAIMGTTVCESVNAAASIFLGMTESVLLFKNYLKDLTKSEMHAIMCEGWATVAGSVMAAYIAFGISPVHLIAASVMSAPAALSYSKLFYPETEGTKTSVKNIVLANEEASNLLDAACKGAVMAIGVVSCIIANIVAILAFIGFLDSVLHWMGLLLAFDDLSFQYVLSKIFIPVSFLMGVDHESLEDVALLVGTKTVVNEFEAYKMLGQMKKNFSARTEAIATYALCGFSNFGSIGILVGTISSLEPRQASNATAVAVRAFIASNIVCFITACVAGTLIDV